MEHICMHSREKQQQDSELPPINGWCYPRKKLPRTDIPYVLRAGGARGDKTERTPSMQPQRFSTVRRPRQKHTTTTTTILVYIFLMRMSWLTAALYDQLYRRPRAKKGSTVSTDNIDGWVTDEVHARARCTTHQTPETQKKIINFVSAHTASTGTSHRTWYLHIYVHHGIRASTPYRTRYIRTPRHHGIYSTSHRTWNMIDIWYIRGC